LLLPADFWVIGLIHCYNSGLVSAHRLACFRAYHAVLVVVQSGRAQPCNRSVRRRVHCRARLW